MVWKQQYVNYTITYRNIFPGKYIGTKSTNMTGHNRILLLIYSDVELTFKASNVLNKP